jgi:hypothetical protein
MIAFGIIALLSAIAVLVVGQIQARRSGGKGRRWAGPMAALGLVVMTVGSVLFEGMESLYVWIAGISLFFVGFFVERIADVKREMRRTEGIDL